MTPLDIGIVLISLVITLGIGLYKGLGVQTLKDYAVGTELLPTAVLVATIITTLIGGGSSSGLASKVFTYGVPFFLVFLGKPLKILFFAYVVAPRMGPFRHCLSLADMMGRRYGKGGRICTAIACLMRETSHLAAQGVALGFMFQYFLGVSLTLGVIIGMGTLSTYAAYGGVRSVTATDVFQLCLLVIAAPLIVNFAVLHFEGHFIPLHILKESHFTLPADPDSRKYLLAMAFVYATPVPEGVVIQRFLMANDLLKLKKALLRVALLMIPILLLFSLIGLIAFLLNPMSDPNLSLPLTIYTFMPMGIKGIAVAGIIAVIMSTADSTLHVMSVLLINDIVKPLTKKKLDEKYLVRLIRLSTFIFGCFAIFVGLWFGDVLDIGLFFMDFWAPLIVIPFFAALFGLKAPSKAFLLSAFVGICSVIFWEYSFASYTVIPGFIIGILANSLVFFLMVGIAPQQLKSIRVWPQNLPDIKNNIKKWFDVTSAIWTPATTFGAIALMIYIFPGFLWDKSWASFPQWLWSLKFGGWIICSMLFLSPYWPQAWQRYFKFFWYSALFYTLPFLFSVYVFESQCATPVVTYLMLSLYVLIILVRWQAYLILTTLGIGLTSLIYSLLSLYGDYQWPKNILPVLSLISFFSMIICLLFQAQERFRQQQSSQKDKKIIQQFSQRIFSTLTRIINQEKKWISLIKQSPRNITLENMERQSQKTINIIDDTRRETDLFLKKCLSPSHLNAAERLLIGELIWHTIDSYPFLEKEREKIILNIPKNNDSLVRAVAYDFTQMIHSIIRYRLDEKKTFGPGKLSLTVLYRKNECIMTFQNIDHHNRQKHPKEISPSEDKKRPAGFNLAHCRSVIAQMNGSIYTISASNQEKTLILSLPISCKKEKKRPYEK